MADEEKERIPAGNIDDGSDGDSEDDADYVPSDHASASEEENSGDDEDFSPEDAKAVSKKGKRKAVRSVDTNPRLSRQQPEDEQSTELKKQIAQEQEAMKEQKEKSRADALWASFMSDVKTGPKKPARPETVTTPASKSVTNGDTKPQSKPKTTKVFEFAGETVSVDSEPAEAANKPDTGTSNKPVVSQKRPGGLGAVLGFINKKQKISTLDKSKLDWDKYKKESGLQEELANHNKSKNSYLEKKEFLERADHRQFEKERDMRLASSSSRR